MHRITLIVRVTAIAFNIFTVLYCFPQKSEVRRRAGYALLAGTLIAVAAARVAAIHAPTSVSVLPLGLFFFIPVACILEAPLSKKIFVFFAHFFVSMTVLLVAAFVAGVFFPRDSGAYFVLYTSSAELLYGCGFLLAVLYGRTFYDRLFSFTTRKIWRFYSLLPVTCWLILNTLYFSPDLTPLPLPQEGRVFYVLPLLFMVLCFVFLCAAIVKTHDNLTATHDLELSRNILRSGREHYEKMAQLSQKVRIMRHDYRHHLAALAGMLDDRKGAAAYLEQVKRQYDELAEPNFCTRRAIDAFLTTFAARCAENDLDFRASLRLPPEGESGPEDYELCIVIANLLENAFEACLASKAARGHISLLSNHQGRQLVLRVQNTFDGVVLRDGDTLSSRKPDGGLGIKSIEAVVKRYDGKYLYEYTDTLFTATVVMTFQKRPRT